MGKKSVIRTVGGWGGVALSCPSLVLQTEWLLVVRVNYVLSWSMFAGGASSQRNPVFVLSDTVL